MCNKIRKLVYVCTYLATIWFSSWHDGHIEMIASLGMSSFIVSYGLHFYPRRLPISCREVWLSLLYWWAVVVR